MEMLYRDQALKEATDQIRDENYSGTTRWRCPSNIALIKYWGKRDFQIPMNPSLSVTLQKSFTTTSVSYNINPDIRKLQVEYYFKERQHPEFKSRINKYLHSLTPYFPFLKSSELIIHSENSFPHSSGIASSASSMGALAMCLCDIETHLSGVTPGSSEMHRKASFIARLGSGSAARSVYPEMALWGASPDWPGSNDEYAIPVTEFHHLFENLHDSILIIESGTKKVSSSSGHELMQTNPFASERYRQARSNLQLLHHAISDGNFNNFIEIIENEALTLHALMMSGSPGYILMKPGTLSVIKLIRDFRYDTGSRVCFSLDAGANVHILYAAKDAAGVKAFLEAELSQYCEEGLQIHDQMGSGPEKLES